MLRDERERPSGRLSLHYRRSASTARANGRVVDDPRLRLQSARIRRPIYDSDVYSFCPTHGPTHRPSYQTDVYLVLRTKRVSRRRCSSACVVPTVWG